MKTPDFVIHHPNLEIEPVPVLSMNHSTLPRLDGRCAVAHPSLGAKQSTSEYLHQGNRERKAELLPSNPTDQEGVSRLQARGKKKTELRIGGKNTE